MCELIDRTRNSFPQDLEKRWQEYTTEHELYDRTYHDCEAWIEDLKHRLESCSSPDGDKFAVQSKLDKLQVSTGALMPT